MIKHKTFYSSPNLYAINNPAINKITPNINGIILKVNPSALVNIPIIEASTNPIMPKYVGTSNFLNKNSIILAIITIPTNTPIPKGTNIDKSFTILLNVVKLLIVFIIGS